MAVYVDELRVWPGPKPRCFNAGSCHLTADTFAELRAFAKRLGLQERWYQDHPVASHYDLTASRRARAVALGAVELSAREQTRRRRAVRLVTARREQQAGDPDEWSDDLADEHESIAEAEAEEIIEDEIAGADPTAWRHV